MGKTQSGLTQPVKTGLNHTKKPQKWGKLGFMKPDFFKNDQNFHQKKKETYFQFEIFGDAKHQLSILCKIIF